MNRSARIIRFMPSSSSAISIIVPTFHEGPNLDPLLQRVFAATSKAGIEAEMIIVDDNSQDGTCDIVEALAERYPVREPRPERRAVRAVLAVLERRGRLLMRRREARGLWGGLWEFPWVEREAGEPVSLAFRRLLAELDVQSPGKPENLGSVRHGLTHLQMEWDCLRSRVTSPNGRRQRPTASGTNGTLQWVDPAKIGEIPLGRPMHKVLRLVRAGGG